jgi:Nanos RNA binding domain
MFSKSQSNQTKQFNQVSPLKTFCKVCLDAGKPESVYTSHFVKASKDENAAIVCPTLLSQECRYCKKNGHTVKYCKVLEKDNKRKERQTKIQSQIKPKPVESKKENKNKNKNVYMALCESDDEEIKTQRQRPIPQVYETKSNTNTNTNTNTVTVTYASIAAKAHQEHQAKEQKIIEQKIKEHMQIKEKEQELEQKSIATRVLPFQPIVRPIKKFTSWADSDNDIDSDEDDEEEEEEEQGEREKFIQVASF